MGFVRQPPLVTVFLPHYRCERYLREAVQSVLEQELHDLELIVVDDSSPTDTCFQILQEFVDDPRLKVYRTSTNVGPYRIKNALLASTSSRYVAFQDADDRSHPSRLLLQIEAMERRGIEILGCSFRYCSQDGRYLRDKRMAGNCNLWLRLGRRFVLLHPTMVIRRRAMNQLGGFDGTTRFAADDDFMLRAVRLFPVRNLRQRLYDYRVRPSSLTCDAASGYGSPARQKYLAVLNARERRRQHAALLGLPADLRAPANDVRFDLREIDLRAF